MVSRNSEDSENLQHGMHHEKLKVSNNFHFA